MSKKKKKKRPPQNEVPRGGTVEVEAVQIVEVDQVAPPPIPRASHDAAAGEETSAITRLDAGPADSLMAGLEALVEGELGNILPPELPTDSIADEEVLEAEIVESEVVESETVESESVSEDQEVSVEPASDVAPDEPAVEAEAPQELAFEAEAPQELAFEAEAPQELAFEAEAPEELAFEAEEPQLPSLGRVASGEIVRGRELSKEKAPEPLLGKVVVDEERPAAPGLVLAPSIPWHRLDYREGMLLARVDGKRTREEVIAASGLEVEEAGKLVAKLREELLLK